MSSLTRFRVFAQTTWRTLRYKIYARGLACLQTHPTPALQLVAAQVPPADSPAQQKSLTDALTELLNPLWFAVPKSKVRWFDLWLVQRD